MATYAAIPTVYNGVQFRSRLEARWAAFFDQLGIRWIYEPEDHHGYIPDFSLPDEGVLVDVKPFDEFTPRADFTLALHRFDDPARAVILGLRPDVVRRLDGWCMPNWDRPAHRKPESEKYGAFIFVADEFEPTRAYDSRWNLAGTATQWTGKR
jgi:hypothetical protein